MGADMSKTTPAENKAIVLEAFDTLFNRRDYAAAERFWSDRYIQHSAHIAPGRAGLFDLVRSLPPTLRYENQLILAEGDYVIAHGRFSGHGRPASSATAVASSSATLRNWDTTRLRIASTCTLVSSNRYARMMCCFSTSLWLFQNSVAWL